jgi:hypothetical protein
MGRRDATNVPAQSLTMLNDPFVTTQADAWSNAVLEDRSLGNDDARIDRMFLTAFGREASATERDRAGKFMADLLGEARRLSRAAKALERQAAEALAAAAALRAPVRERLLAAQENTRGGAPGPAPAALWEFDDDLEDAVGGLHGRVHGSARLQGGALVLDGGGHVTTAPLDRPLRAKTLEVLVTLSDLDQRGGGAISVESIGGGLFDSIVFGEQESRRWLAGSNHFQRTRPLRGAAESTAHRRPVHIAIAYDEDGSVRAYRDGEPYGHPYRSNGPLTFKARDSVVVFGLRHSPPSDNRRLRGRIHQARLYDRALSAEEVRACFEGGGFVSDQQLLAALTAPQRATLSKLEARARDATARRDRMAMPRTLVVSERRAWRDLARCLLSMKEFIYIR